MVPSSNLKDQFHHYLQTLHSSLPPCHHQVSPSSNTTPPNIPPSTTDKVNQYLFEQLFQSIASPNRPTLGNGTLIHNPQATPNQFSPPFFNSSLHERSSGSPSPMYLPHQPNYSNHSQSTSISRQLFTDLNAQQQSNGTRIESPYNDSQGTSPSPTRQTGQFQRPVHIVRLTPRLGNVASLPKPNANKPNANSSHALVDAPLPDSKRQRMAPSSSSSSSSSSAAPMAPPRPDPLFIKVNELTAEISGLKNDFEQYKVKSAEDLNRQNKTIENLINQNMDLINHLHRLKTAHQLLAQSEKATVLRQQELLKWQTKTDTFKKEVEGLLNGALSIQSLKDKKE